jgi:hypothetical protein
VPLGGLVDPRRQTLPYLGRLLRAVRKQHLPDLPHH